MQEGYVEHLFYKIIGEGEPLVFIAGLGADHQAWTPLVNILSKQYKCIIFDNRGIGRSAYPDDGECTIKKMAEDVCLLLDNLHQGSASIVGHSLGGYVAQVLAACYPKQVRKLILLSSKSRSQAVQNLYQETTISMMKQNINRELIVNNALCWLFSSTYLSDPINLSNLINVSLKKPLEESRKSYFYQVDATLNFDISIEARKISSPTLIMSGDQDLLVPLADAVNISNLIYNSQLDILEGMGHMPHIEIPIQIAKRISQFMEQASSG